MNGCSCPPSSATLSGRHVNLLLVQSMTLQYYIDHLPYRERKFATSGRLGRFVVMLIGLSIACILIPLVYSGIIGDDWELK